MTETRKNSLVDIAVEAIVAETVVALPDDILQFYRNLPGRRPSEHSLRLQGVLSKLTDEEARILIRDIVDSSIFSVLSLIDQGFKDRNIATSFTVTSSDDSPVMGRALEIYRQRVNPGGQITSEFREHGVIEVGPSSC